MLDCEGCARRRKVLKRFVKTIFNNKQYGSHRDKNDINNQNEDFRLKIRKRRS